MQCQRPLVKVTLVALLVVAGSLISARAEPDPVCASTTNVTTVRAAQHPVWDPSYENAGTSTTQRWQPPPRGVPALPRDEDDLKELIGPVYLGRPAQDGQPAQEVPDDELYELIKTDRGGGVVEGDIDWRAKNALATYNLALLFHITGNGYYGHKAAVLLDAYADKFYEWQYNVCSDGDKEELENAAGYKYKVNKCGIWSLFHSDMAVSSYLALAYDLLAPE